MDEVPPVKEVSAAPAEDDLPTLVDDEDEQPPERTQREQAISLYNRGSEEESDGPSLMFALFSFQGVDFDGFIGLQLSPFLALVDTGAQHAVVGPAAWENI